MEGLLLLEMSSTQEALKSASSDYDKVNPASSVHSSRSFDSPAEKAVYGPARLTYAPARRRLSFAIVIPAVVVILVTAGTATTLLVWLLTHKTQRTLHDVWTDGAFVLDEGTKFERGNQAARLTGLTISSAASTAVALTGPVLMGLYAFNIAHQWLEAGHDAEGEGSARLPEPIHFGLILQLLVGGGPVSLWRTSSFLARSNKVNRNALLISTFVVAVIVFILTHAISAVDLWLHTSVSAISQNSTLPLASSLPYSIGQDACSPYPSDPEQRLELIYPCLYGPGSWANLSVKTTGMTVAANASNDIKAITLNDANDLAVLVPFHTEPNVLFYATSFGARASCQSLNSLCSDKQDGSDASSLNCPGFTNSGFPPTKFPPINGTGPTDGNTLGEGETKVFIQSSGCANCSHVDSTKILSTDDTSTMESDVVPQNAYSLWMQFIWMDDSDQPFGRSPPGSNAVWNTANFGYMIVNCTLSFYNVTLSSSKGEYSLVQEVLTDPGISDGFAAPTRLAHFSSQLMANVQGPVLTLNSTDSAMAALSQDLARLAISSAGALTTLRLDTIEQELINEVLVGWYPVAPIIVFLVLLYAYAALALGIFVRTVVFARSIMIQDHDGDRRVSALELAVMRLTNPLTLVAALFLPKFTRDSAASVETDTLKLFRENGGSETRLKVGLQPDGEAFGVWNSAVTRTGYRSAIEE